MELVKIPTVSVSYQMREITDQAEIMNSISQIGLVEPIVVTKRYGESEIYAVYDLVSGLKRLIATKALGIKFIYAIVHEYGSPEEASVAKIDANLFNDYHDGLDKAEMIANRAYFLSRISDRNIDALDVVDRLKINKPSKDYSKSATSMRIAAMSPRVKKKIAGTWLEKEEGFLEKLSEQKKSLQEKIANLALEGMSIDQAIDRVEKRELKGQVWPPHLDDVFVKYRKQLIKLLPPIRSLRETTYEVLKKIGKDKKMKKIAVISKIALHLFEELESLIINKAIPKGPCPRCEWRGCEICNTDGWGTEEIFRLEEAKSPTLYKRLKI